jgi:hypothetical protein
MRYCNNSYSVQISPEFALHVTLMAIYYAKLRFTVPSFVQIRQRCHSPTQHTVFGSDNIICWTTPNWELVANAGPPNFEFCRICSEKLRIKLTQQLYLYLYVWLIKTYCYSIKGNTHNNCTNPYLKTCSSSESFSWTFQKLRSWRSLFLASFLASFFSLTSIW